MEVELVELVLRHEVQQAEHVLHGVEVPGHVQHQTAVSEPGGVHDTSFWYLAYRQRVYQGITVKSEPLCVTEKGCYFIHLAVADTVFRFFLQSLDRKDLSSYFLRCHPKRL